MVARESGILVQGEPARAAIGQGAAAFAWRRISHSDA